MVLVSHRYQFIHIRTRKTASSSVEHFFKRYALSPEQELSYHIPTTEEGWDASSDEYGIISSSPHLSSLDCQRPIQNTVNRRRPWLIKKQNWRVHKRAYYIRRDLGRKLFNRYFKFCTVRNPWDRAVSHYKWRCQQEAITSSFPDFLARLKIGHGLSLTYAISGHTACDFHIRYEHLQEDIKACLEHLGIQNYTLEELPHFKKQSTEKSYRSYYNAKTKDLIAQKYKSEIEQFSYEF